MCRIARGGAGEIIRAYPTSLDYSFDGCGVTAKSDKYDLLDYYLSFLWRHLAFLMVMMARIKGQKKGGFKGSLHTLLEKLSSIRLATFIESPATKSKGRHKANYRLEEMDPDIYELAEAMGVTGTELKTKIPFSVYT